MPDDPQDEFLSSVSDSGGYDPNGFYTASRNKKGFKTTLYLATTPEIASAVGELVASRVFPYYKTPGDVHRNGLVHILERDKNLAKDASFVNITDRLVQSLMIESDAEKMRTVADSRQRVFDTISDMIRGSYAPEVREEVRPMIRAMLDKCSPGPTRDQFEQMFASF